MVRTIVTLRLIALVVLGAASVAHAAPTWRPIATQNPSLPPAFAFPDPARGRLIVLGEDGSDNNLSVWELPLAGPFGLHDLIIEGTPPVRTFAAAFDAAGNRILLFDYFDPPGTLRALELSPTPRWTTFATTGDVPDQSAMLETIVDPVRRELIVYEHAGDKPPGNSIVRRLDLATNVWTRPPVVGDSPPGRDLGAAVYDSRRHRMILHGGETGFAIQHDLWALDLGDTIVWTALQLDGADARDYSRHLGAYDSTSDRLLVFGGSAGSHAEVRAYDFASGVWSLVIPAGSGPGALVGPYFAVDPDRQRLLVGGGRPAPNADSDLALWTLGLGAAPAWSRVMDGDALALPRAAAGATWDTRRGRAIVWGGRSTSYYSHDYYTTYPVDLWSLSFGARALWSDRTPYGNPPPSRRQLGTLSYDPIDDAAWLFGGTLDYPYWHLGNGIDRRFVWYPDLWRLDLTFTPKWTPVLPASPGPSGRDGHAAAMDVDHHRLFVYGGQDSLTAALGDLWALSLDAPYSWTRFEALTPAPAPRVFPVLVCDAARHRLVLFGGRAADGTSLDDAWTMDLDQPGVWQPLVTSGVAPRTAGSRPGLWDAGRSRLLVFGEGDAVTPEDHQRVWALDLSGAATWSEITIDGMAQRDRAAACAVFDPVRDQAVLIWGGRGDVLDATEDVSARLVFADAAPQPTHVAFLSAEPDTGLVELEWSTDRTAGFRSIVERHEKTTPWSAVAELDPDAVGSIRLLDRAVEPGHRYGYRLAWSDDAGWGSTEERWVTVPDRASNPPAPPPSLRFALEPPRPNPAAEFLEIPFALAAPGPARLELIDIAGRVVLVRDVYAGTSGSAVERIDLSRVRSGLYFVRLRQGGLSLERRAVVVR